MVIRRTAVLPQPCWLHCSALEADACTEAKWKIDCMYTHFAQDFVKFLFQVLLHTSVYFYWPTGSTFDRDYA